MIDHWQTFSEFALYELAAGGPDPHMRYVGYEAERLHPPNEKKIQAHLLERAWMGGVYVAFYNYAAAEQTWNQWPMMEVLLHPEQFRNWMHTSWKGLPTRRERRAVRTPEKMHQCLVAYASWLSKAWNQGLFFTQGYNEFELYELFWQNVSNLLYFGRYACFKLLEFYRRYCELPIAMPDIRPVGGWSPRETLAMLWPTRAAQLAPKSNDRVTINYTNHVAAETFQELEMRTGLTLDYYLMEVFLCDYKQSYVGKRQYPGRSNDSELGYFAKAAQYWGSATKTNLFAVRSALHPGYPGLGELAGWYGTRDELGTVLAEQGYTWTDWKYRYTPDMDLADPDWHDGELSDEDLRDLARAALPKQQPPPFSVGNQAGSL
jgi:hypothetical protein